MRSPIQVSHQTSKSRWRAPVLSDSGASMQSDGVSPKAEGMVREAELTLQSAFWSWFDWGEGIKKLAPS